MIGSVNHQTPPQKHLKQPETMANPANLMKMKKTKTSKKVEAENIKDSKPRQFADEKERLRNRDRKSELGEYTVVCLEEDCEYLADPVD